MITTDHDPHKYITNQEFNKLTSTNFTWRVGKLNLVSMCAIGNFVKKTDLKK